jgi:biopolymer transport protein ExbD
VRPFVDHERPPARIDLTPVIGVALVLVLILLITAPLVAVRDFGVTLPAAEFRGDPETNRVTLTLGPQGELAVDDQLVSTEELSTEIASRLASARELHQGAEPLLVVRADATARHHEVRALIQSATASGATRIAVATLNARGNDDVVDG